MNDMDFNIIFVCRSQEFQHDKNLDCTPQIPTRLLEVTRIEMFAEILKFLPHDFLVFFWAIVCKV